MKELILKHQQSMLLIVINNREDLVKSKEQIEAHIEELNKIIFRLEKEIKEMK